MEKFCLPMELYFPTGVQKSLETFLAGGREEVGYMTDFLKQLALKANDRDSMKE